VIPRARHFQKKLDERRFRFRARFERPEEGVWKLEDGLTHWLDKKLGRDNYALHGDDWEGHGWNSYALHFDDHTIIPELLDRLESLRAEVRRVPSYVVSITREQARAVRSAIVALQACLVDKLNAEMPRVTWAMGRCEVLRDMPQTEGERVHISNINMLTEVDRLLSVNDGTGSVRLEDGQRGAIEVALLHMRDLRPAPVEHIAVLRAFLSGLVDVSQ